MGIERQREPALAHRPGNLRLVLMLARVFVDLLAGIRVFQSLGLDSSKLASAFAAVLWSLV
jgi:hypothetical protein